MKNQALFSSKHKSKKFKCCLLQLLFGTLRVKGAIYPGQFSCMLPLGIVSHKALCLEYCLLACMTRTLTCYYCATRLPHQALRQSRPLGKGNRLSCLF